MAYIFPWMNKHKPETIPISEPPKPDPQKAAPVGIIQVPTQPPYKEKKVTFTKLYMVLIGLLYLAGAMLGASLVLWAASLDASAGRPIDPQMFIAYAGYLAGPTAVAIGFYAWKSKSENLLKIKNSFDKQQITLTGLEDINQQVISTLANM